MRKEANQGRLRIIPAYAGSTLRDTPGLLILQDHPRVCGEHLNPAAEGDIAGGSSPRMRGAPELGYEPAESTGIIPAYAGSTRRRPCSGRLGTDHPRVCGEHKVLSNARRTTQGSSPRMRGAPPRTLLHGAWRRIIPAYAGSTFCQRYGQ